MVDSLRQGASIAKRRHDTLCLLEMEKKVIKMPMRTVYGGGRAMLKLALSLILVLFFISLFQGGECVLTYHV